MDLMPTNPEACWTHQGMLWNEVAPFIAGSATPARRRMARAICCPIGLAFLFDLPGEGKATEPL